MGGGHQEGYCPPGHHYYKGPCRAVPCHPRGGADPSLADPRPKHAAQLLRSRAHSRHSLPQRFGRPRAAGGAIPRAGGGTLPSQQREAPHPRVTCPPRRAVRALEDGSARAAIAQRAWHGDSLLLARRAVTSRPTCCCCRGFFGVCYVLFQYSAKHEVSRRSHSSAPGSRGRLADAPPGDPSCCPLPRPQLCSRAAAVASAAAGEVPGAQDVDPLVHVGQEVPQAAARC
jgi:hypothetical protein